VIRDNPEANSSFDERMDVREEKMHEHCPAEWMFNAVDDCEPGVQRPPYSTR
jgi:hypothetical protein